MSREADQGREAQRNKQRRRLCRAPIQTRTQWATLSYRPVRQVFLDWSRNLHNHPKLIKHFLLDATLFSLSMLWCRKSRKMTQDYTGVKYVEIQKSVPIDCKPERGVLYPKVIHRSDVMKSKPVSYVDLTCSTSVTVYRARGYYRPCDVWHFMRY